MIAPELSQSNLAFGSVQIDRAVIFGNIYNEKKPEIGETAEQWKAQLEARHVDVCTIASVAGGITANAALLAENSAYFGASTLAVTVGGDGTNSLFVNSEKRASVEHPGMQEPLHLFLPKGTADDNAKSLSHPRYLRDLESIEQRGTVRNIHLLEARLQRAGLSPEEAEKFDVIGYGSAGPLVGLTSKKFNEPRVRDSELWGQLAQARAILESLSEAEAALLSIDGAAPQAMADVMILSGQRMGTTYHGTSSLTEYGYRTVELASPRTTYIAGQIGLLIGQRFARRPLNTGETTITAHSPNVILQYDGETQDMSVGDSVTFSPGRTIRAVTTRRFHSRNHRRTSGDQPQKTAV